MLWYGVQKGGVVMANRNRQTVTVDEIEMYCVEMLREFSKLKHGKADRESVGEMFGYGNVWHFIHGNNPVSYEKLKTKRSCNLWRRCLSWLSSRPVTRLG